MELCQIKTYRLKRGLTQSELAQLLGVKRSTVTAWELGNNSPRAAMLVKLSSILNCRIDDFYR